MMVSLTGSATTRKVAVAASDFEIGYQASTYDGSIIWYNRSVHVTGVFKATGWRRVYARAFPSSANVDFVSSSTWCNTIGKATLPLDTSNVIGGPTKIWVYMTDGDQKYIAGQTCYPSLRDCVTGLK